MAVANYCATLDTGNMFFKLLLPTVVCLFKLAESLEFSQSEWLNPSRPGSSIYIRNDRAKPVRIISVYIRNDGFQNSGEVALNINGGKYFFTAKSSKVGEWSRLIPEKGAKKFL